MQPENRPPMTIEEQRRRRIAERIQQMAGDDAPPITPEETPLKSDLSSVQTPFADESLSTYRDRFFAHRSSARVGRPSILRSALEGFHLSPYRSRIRLIYSSLRLVRCLFWFI